ncbi:MAG TPA: acetyl-CoA carboxylase biotin carboxyl carrier protein [Thermoanaerobaculia bacterium]|nr:acetyl-CoA carboxylase biotin carboxyl carrier protein [Thermoanaerobaculia bacterium]
MAFLTFKEILELIDRVADRGLGAVEIESAGLKLRVEGKRNEVAAASAQAAAVPGPEAAATGAPAAPRAPAVADAGTAAPAATESEEGLHIVTSPIVGTFYRSANPEAEPFVDVGDRIGKGNVLCIIEAMKLMNEIESDVEGVVTRVYPQNGQPVEYGEKLFAVSAG